MSAEEQALLRHAGHGRLSVLSVARIPHWHDVLADLVALRCRVTGLAMTLDTHEPPPDLMALLTAVDTAAASAVRLVEHELVVADEDAR